MEKKLEIIWNKKASRKLAIELQRISKESVFQAERVEKAILSSLAEILRHPEKYPRDKYKINNSGEFRAYEIYSFRISYKYSTQKRLLEY